MNAVGWVLNPSRSFSDTFKLTFPLETLRVVGRVASRRGVRQVGGQTSTEQNTLPGWQTAAEGEPYVEHCC